MTLYRINLEAAGTHDAPFAKGLPGALPFLIEDGVLVEVEPCVHGKYDAHGSCRCIDRDGVMGYWWNLRTEYTSNEWIVCDHARGCPGAGIGDTE